VGSVRTPIIGRPRPLPGHRHANPRYTLKCDEPINYPEQQLANGRQKNTATNGRYKQLVRILKRLENGLVAAGTIDALPSYLMECLVYPVSNSYFIPSSTTTTPLTDICQRVFLDIWVATKAGGKAANWVEPNGIKPLFSGSQPWTMEKANELALRAWTLVDGGSK